MKLYIANPILKMVASKVSNLSKKIIVNLATLDEYVVKNNTLTKISEKLPITPAGKENFQEILVRLHPDYLALKPFLRHDLIELAVKRSSEEVNARKIEFSKEHKEFVLPESVRKYRAAVEEHQKACLEAEKSSSKQAVVA